MADVAQRSTLDVFQALYDSEINCSLASDWNDGWRVTLEHPGGARAEATVGSVIEAAQWLHDRAHELFPDSEYVRRHPR